MTNGIMTLETKREERKQRIEQLKAILEEKEITILGHDNIDVDATLSGMLLSNLLNFLCIENEFRILEQVKENDTYEIIRETIGIDIKNFQKEGENKERNLFLVDHYETVHEGTVVACLDHHPTKQKKDYPFWYVRNSCATAYLIYELMEEVGYPLNEKEAKMIVVSMMVDTTAFRSSKTIQEEVEQAKKIAQKYQLDYDFLEKYCLCLTPIEKMTTEEIISNGQKWYDYAGKQVGSSYLQLYGLPKEKQLQEWLKALSDKRKEKKKEMLVFLLFECKENKTYEYQITEDCCKETIKEGILSRGKDIMPLIEERYLEEKNTEEKTEAIVKRYQEQGKTIATMESCTGGAVASQITDVSGASEVLMESYVSYCNGAKIKFGVPEYIINRYTVYSEQTAKVMARAVKNMAYATIGIGITGQLGRLDPSNLGGINNVAWYAITQENQEVVSKLWIKEGLTRAEKKQVIVREIVEDLYHLL